MRDSSRITLRVEYSRMPFVDVGTVGALGAVGAVGTVGSAGAAGNVGTVGSRKPQCMHDYSDYFVAGLVSIGMLVSPFSVTGLSRLRDYLHRWDCLPRTKRAR